MTALKWFLIVGLTGYFGLVALLYFAQRAIMYFPERARTSPQLAGLPEANEVLLDTADGERVIAWHVPPAPEKPVVLYFHGNGGALRYRVKRFRALIADGTGLLALSYRGYGGSSGRPSQAGFMADADALYGFAVARYAPERLVLWGKSIGAGIAVPLAASKPVGKLILEAPFTSAADVGARAYPIFPVRLLMKDQFRSHEHIGAVRAPVLMLHGERDDIVPIVLGEQLFAAIAAPKRFARFPEGGHNDLDDHGALEVARAFLAETGR